MIKVFHNKFWHIRTIIFTTFLGFLLISCGGGGGSSGDSYAGGGIGGTGKYTGVISGFGSVFVNGIEFSTSGATITVDGIRATENELHVGMKVQINARNNVATSIVFESEVKGQVDNIDPPGNTLTVLGQTIVVDSSTIFKNVNDLTGLRSDDEVEVSGFFRSDGSILATYIKKETSPLSKYKVRGYVSDLNMDNKTFYINNLFINCSRISNFPSLTNNTFVSVEGVMNGGSFIATSLKIPLTFINPGDEAEIEGVITRMISQNEFEVGDIRVQVTQQTKYEHGTHTDLAQDVRIEVEGKVNADGVLIAKEIEFLSKGNKEVAIEGRVMSVDTSNNTLVVMGITIYTSPTTQFYDNSNLSQRSFSLDDIRVGDFIEIGGFVNIDGESVVAVRVEREDSGEDKLMGPVVSKNPENDSLQILNVTVDVSGAQFKDQDDNQINKDTFFSNINEGDIVEVEGAYGGGVLNASTVEIEKIL
jgi:hypothetical protein